eukprot:m.96062 g.96062  ORF g.96062 m.96062 type:complete len:391 (-) comp8619_c0_seq1:252-1424(-)
MVQRTPHMLVGVYWRRPVSGESDSSDDDSSGDSPPGKRARHWLAGKSAVLHFETSAAVPFAHASAAILSKLRVFARDHISFFDADMRPVASDQAWRTLLSCPRPAIVLVPGLQAPFAAWTERALAGVHIRVSPTSGGPYYPSHWLDDDLAAELAQPLSPREERLVNRLCEEIRRGVLAFGYTDDTNDAQKRVTINTVLSHVKFCFQRENLRIEAGRPAEGSLGRGRVDYWLASPDRALAIVVAPGNTIDDAIAPAIAQLVTLGEDCTGVAFPFRQNSSEAPDRQVSYAVITTGLKWHIVKLDTSAPSTCPTAEFSVSLAIPLVSSLCFDQRSTVFESTTRELFHRLIALVHVACRPCRFPTHGGARFPCACCLRTADCCTCDAPPPASIS